MTLKGTQRDDKAQRISDIGIFVLSIVAYVVFSFATCFVFSYFIQNYLTACVLAFTSVGFVTYLGMHFVLPAEMSRFDGRLLHELAKRKLVEFQSVEDDRSKLK